MIVTNTRIEGLKIIKPTLHTDYRGYFYETFNEETYQNLGIRSDFKQDNQSLSKKNVLRGLHFQNHPHAQGKLVRVIKGSVQDVAVDLRAGSPTYGQYVSVILSERNKRSFWIPPGFAHGFLSLEDDTIFSYKCTNNYNKMSEDTLLWNDETLNIDWLIDDPIISDKDEIGKKFIDFKTLF
jgi:dTDP-4-dehydrorhamnose 3,5-epimerase